MDGLAEEVGVKKVDEAHLSHEQLRGDWQARLFRLLRLDALHHQLRLGQNIHSRPSLLRIDTSRDTRWGEMEDGGKRIERGESR